MLLKIYGLGGLSKFNDKEIKLAGTAALAHANDKSFDTVMRDAFFDLLEVMVIEEQDPIYDLLLHHIYIALIDVFSRSSVSDFVVRRRVYSFIYNSLRKDSKRIRILNFNSDVAHHLDFPLMITSTQRQDSELAIALMDLLLSCDTNLVLADIIGYDQHVRDCLT